MKIVKIIKIFKVSIYPYNISTLVFPNGTIPNTGMLIKYGNTEWKISGIVMTSEGHENVDILYENSKLNIWDCSLELITGTKQLTDNLELSILEAS